MLAFPEGGPFPFAPSSFWPLLAMVLLLLWVLRDQHRALRIGLGLYALAMVASFALDTPMGGNVTRLGAIFAGPVAAALLWPDRRRALTLLALPLLYWQWVAPVDDLRRVHGDPSRHERYHAGVARYLNERGPARVEVPLTENFWEARWLAPHVPLARGWERQLDIERNALFYDDGELTAERYRGWLDANAIRFVALPDAPLDGSATDEAELIRAGLPYLREVWSDEHWRVYEVANATPLARGAGARVTAIAHDELRLHAARPGTIDLRVRFTPYWRITTGAGCVERAPGDWTRIRATRPGALTLRTSFALDRVRATSPRCSGSAP